MGAPIIFSGSFGKMLNQGGIKFPNGTIWPQPTITNLSGTSIDWSLSTYFYKVLTGNTTFTFTGAVGGQIIRVRLTQDSSVRTVTWPTVKWTAGAAPVMSVGSGAIDLYTFVYDSVGGYYIGTALQNVS